jgi:hypothetical protein
MSTVVQTRLNPETQALLDRLVEEKGLTPSEALRRGIKLLAEAELKPRRRGLIGAGMFDSGVSDLSTNKKYMEDFGVKSMGKGWKRPTGNTQK